MRKLRDIECLYFTPLGFCKAATAEYLPYIYVEADIVFNDIRTGYKCAAKIARALKIYEEQAIPRWSDEIILDADIDMVLEIQPCEARLKPPPEFIDAEFINIVKNRHIEHLTRSWKKILYRNSELDIYSGAGESREAFIIRCREQFSARMREELNELRVVFNRMKEQLKEKYLEISELELPDPDPLTPEINGRSILSRYAEHIDALFIKAASSIVDAAADMPLHSDKKSEFEERLMELAGTARRRIAFLHESYENRPELVDEYILRPNLKNIHCERVGILWMPEKSE